MENIIKKQVILCVDVAVIEVFIGRRNDVLLVDLDVLLNEEDLHGINLRILVDDEYQDD